MLLGDRAVVPSGLVEAQQLLEIPDAMPVIMDAQHLLLGQMVDGDAKRARAAGVLQQLGDQREPVGEGEALVAQCAFFVDADLDLHGDLLKCQRPPRTAGSPPAGW